MTRTHYIFGTLLLIIAALLLAWFFYNSTTPTEQTTTATADTMTETDELTNYEVDQADIVVAAPLIAAIPATALTAAETEDLLFIREEEKLAHDLYVTLYDIWGVQIFNNIAQSEVSHMAAMNTLIERYNLTDPVIDTIGAFSNPTLQTIYDEWLAEGSMSLLAAMNVGARVEDIDIKDLAEAIARTDNTDIATVYENLLRGSRNHMRAFNRQIVNLTGENYVPEYISVAELEAILSESVERGPQGGRRSGGA